MSETGGDAAVMRTESSATSVGHADSPDDLIAKLYEVVADALGLDPNYDRVPIRDTVDPEALAHVFNQSDADAYVSFPVEDRRVTVHSDGSVLVHDSFDV